LPKQKNSGYYQPFLCKRRAAIEPIIGHLKSDFRLSRNLLKGQVGDEINVLYSSLMFTAPHPQK
jgi:hypothetical protein